MKVSVPVGILMLGTVVAGACRPRTDTERAAASEPRIPVRTAIVDTRDLTETVTLTGTLNPRAHVTVVAEIPARLLEVLRDEGDRVSRGAVVAVLDAIDYRLARDRAQAALALAEANQLHARAEEARAASLLATGGITDKDRSAAQVAMQVAYPRLDLKIVGFLPGLTTLLGVSHQAIDDVALMRALPNMTILEPRDADQVRECVREANAINGPVYLRMRRFDDDDGARVLPPVGRCGELTVVREGDGPLVLAAGIMVGVAVRAAETISADGIAVRVVDVSRIKPLPAGSIVDASRRAGAVVVVENHSIIGGLGSAVAETLLEAGVACAFERVGVRDTFAEGGSTGYLFERYGLSVDAVIGAVHRVLQKASR